MAFEDDNVEAENGRDREREGQELKPNSILLELAMPVMTGCPESRANQRLTMACRSNLRA